MIFFDQTEGVALRGGSFLFSGKWGRYWVVSCIWFFQDGFSDFTWVQSILDDIQIKILVNAGACLNPAFFPYSQLCRSPGRNQQEDFMSLYSFGVNPVDSLKTR